MKEFEADKEQYEKERQHLEDNLKKISKKGVDIVSLLQDDYDKAKQDLQLSEKKLEETKLQIQQNEGLRENSEKNLSKYQAQWDDVKQKLQGKLYLRIGFTHNCIETKESLITSEKDLLSKQESHRRTEVELENINFAKCKITQEKKQKLQRIEELNFKIDEK